MKKVLILTASFGDGHNTAAHSMRDAVHLLSETARVEVIDLLEASYGSLYELVRNTHLKVVQFAPRLWSGIYSLLDHAIFLDQGVTGLGRLKAQLRSVLESWEPDAVISTYPLYGPAITQLLRAQEGLPFRFLTVITDSVSVNATWFRGVDGSFIVANEATAEVLRAGGVAAGRVHALGFPVNPAFAMDQMPELPYPGPDEPWRILYVINSGQKKAGRFIDRLLELPNVRLTITVGRDAWLKSKLMERTRPWRDRVQILGWTNQMPALLRSHHLVIGKAGGATVQEAIAALCPMIINQVIPGQESGNAKLIADLELGAVAETSRQVIDAVEQAFSQYARRWSDWRNNMRALSKPDAALRIAERALAATETPSRGDPIEVLRPSPTRTQKSGGGQGDEARMMLCDFHIHTNYSDGRMTLPEVVDLYGGLGFDGICITDHLVDPNRLQGKMAHLRSLTLGADQLDEYFEVIARERARAWKKYRMLVMAGLEFNKDSGSKKSSVHLLGIDLRYPVDPGLEVTELIAAIQEQGGLAVASHPHSEETAWGKDTLYLWERQDRFAPLLDAWEIATRDSLFNPAGLKSLPFLVNSDFHKAKHVYSWKTVLHCPKDPESIKTCVRTNRNVAITYFRKEQSANAPRGLVNATREAPAAVPRVLALPGLPAAAGLK